jgi:4'-phosphopantetheinyl transferase
MNRLEAATVRRVCIRFARIVPDPARLAAARSVLAPDELIRAAAFRRDRDREEYLLGRAMLRRLLSRALGCAPSGLIFHYGADGKPLLTLPEPGLRFTVSHSRGGLLVAWSMGRDVGVDLEWMDPARVSAGVGRRAFSPRQLRRFEQAHGTERTRLFYRFWTRMEAAAKATGQGVSAGHERDEGIKVRSFCPALGFMAAVAAHI